MNKEEEIKKEIEELAILLHHKYEIFSQEEKWKSQDLCRDKPFSQLPLANQKVMMRMAEYVSSLIDTALEQGEAKGKQERDKEILGIIEERMIRHKKRYHPAIKDVNYCRFCKIHKELTQKIKDKEA